MKEDMVVIDLDGKVVEGNLKPSSDAPPLVYTRLLAKARSIPFTLGNHMAQAGKPSCLWHHPCRLFLRSGSVYIGHDPC